LKRYCQFLKELQITPKKEFTKILSLSGICVLCASTSEDGMMNGIVILKSAIFYLIIFEAHFITLISFQIPQISYSSTSSDLSDKTRFGYFSRVVPPDNLQAQAMVDIIVALGWTYVSAIADEGSYGETGVETFKQQAEQRGICIAAYEKVKRGFHDHDFLSLVSRLEKNKAVGVIMFVHEDNIRKVKFCFDRYFTSLNPRHYRRNPWFKEFWEHEFNCSVKLPSCYGNCLDIDWQIYVFTHLPFAELSLARGHKQEGYVPYVIDAVYTLAHALKAMIASHCGDRSFHACDLSVKFNGSELLQYIRRVNFIRLDEKGDRMGMYEIYQFQGLKRHYVSVGKWTDRIVASTDDENQKAGSRYKSGIIPDSDCAKPCGFNEVRSQSGSCCWACIPCNASSIMPNESSCIPCQLGLLPNSAKNECVPMIPESIEWGSWWAIGPSVFSSLGILVTLSVMIVFIKYNQVSVIKASGRELCFVMIIGITCSYCMTFLLLHRPNQVTCAIQRISIGLSSCITYAAILTKTNRVARIFTSNVQDMQSLRFISPKAQLLICMMLISVQLLTACVWMIVEPPKTSLVFPNRFTAVQSCNGGPLLFPVSMVYNMLLIVMCTIYAFKTRKIPENFNETKHIGFTMYATCIIWLAFIPIYFGTNDNYKIQTISLCICISISGTVALCCFFMPKIYMVLYQPIKVKQQARMAGLGRAQLDVLRQQMQLIR
uniref:G_PROTEIN_RECEP_F3_4 domain-containing protein n=1 Tax=Soboliphyme baturini TaxID=241478 RepID=A0A183ISG7_9BILA